MVFFKTVLNEAINDGSTIFEKGQLKTRFAGFAKHFMGQSAGSGGDSLRDLGHQ